MGKVKNPIRLVAHQHAGLSLSCLSETGGRVYVDFSGGYATVDDEYLIEQLLDSPLRGPGRPHDFMMLGNDDEIRKMISGIKTATHVMVGDYSKLNVQDAITQLLRDHAEVPYTPEQVIAGLAAGGYVSKSATFIVMVRKTLSELEQKGIISRDGTNWQFAG